MTFLARLIVVMVLARLLTPNEFGVVGMATLVVDFGRKFTEIGMAPAIVQRKNLLPIHISSGNIANVILNVVMFFALFFSAPWIATFFDSEQLVLIIKVLAVSFIIRSAYAVPMALLHREMEFKRIVLIESTSYIFGYGFFGVAAALLDFGLWSLVLAIIIEATFLAILTLYYMRKRLSYRFSYTAFKDLLSFGIGQSIYQLGNYFALQGDNFIIGKFLGSSALGLYGRAYQLVSMPSKLFAQAIGKVIFPAFSKIQDDTNKIERIYINGLKIAGTVIIPFGVFLSFLTPEIITILLGKQWLGATMPMKVFAFMIFFRIFYAIGNIVLKSTGKVFEMASMQIAYGIMVLFFSYLGSRYYGITGVAIGVGVSIIIHSIIVTIVLSVMLNFSIYKIVKGLLPQVLLGIVTYLMFYLLDELLDKYIFTPVVSVILYGAMMVMLSTLCVYLWPKAFLGMFNEKVQQFFEHKFKIGRS